MIRPTLSQLIELLNLEPLTGEGGLFRQTWRSKEQLPEGFRPGAESKPVGTAIQYLITPRTFSRLHRLPTDEVYHFYLGDPVEMFLVSPQGEASFRILGQDLLGGMAVQTVVPAGWWQGSRLKEGGQWALVGTTMAPGYTDEDYEDADPSAMKEMLPQYAQLIDLLTAPAETEA